VGYGAWSAAVGLINPAIEGLDRILIGFVLGAKPVALYSVPYGLTDKVRVLPDALQRSLLPRFARHVDAGGAAEQAGAAARLLMITMTLIVAPALFVLGPFLKLWVGNEFAVQATPIGQVLLLGMWASAPAMIARALLQGRGRPDRVAKLQLAQALPYLGLLWVLLERWGLIGAAIAWSLRGFIDASLTFWISGLFRTNLLLAFPCMLLLVAAFAVAYLNDPPLFLAVGYGCAFALCAVLLAYLITPEFFPTFARKRGAFRPGRPTVRPGK
jgi:O-antigen/teichoic acid export membrane protein